MSLQKKIEHVISWSRFDDPPDPRFYYNGLLKMTELNIFHNASNILYMVWSTETDGGCEERRREGSEGRETDRGRGRKRGRERKGGGEGVKKMIKKDEEEGARGERQREGGSLTEIEGNVRVLVISFLLHFFPLVSVGENMNV